MLHNYLPGIRTTSSKLGLLPSLEVSSRSYTGYNVKLKYGHHSLRLIALVAERLKAEKGGV
jgi:hypothetical protein